jgi:hypothetical protein
MGIIGFDPRTAALTQVSKGVPEDLQDRVKPWI